MTEEEAKKQLDDRMRALQEKYELRLETFANRVVLDLVDSGKIQVGTKQEIKQMLMQMADEVLQ